MAYWHAPRGPTWRYGFPPMHYPSHSTAFLTAWTGERITEVSCMGWGDDTQALKDNTYKNPFGTAPPCAATNRGHFAKMSLFWHVPGRFRRAGHLVRHQDELLHARSRAVRVPS